MKKVVAKFKKRISTKVRRQEKLNNNRKFEKKYLKKSWRRTSKNRSQFFQKRNLEER